MVEQFMNVSAVGLILPKMMRTLIPNYLCVGETISYFVPKQFIKRKLKQVKSKGITWMLLQVHAKKWSKGLYLPENWEFLLWKASWVGMGPLFSPRAGQVKVDT